MSQTYETWIGDKLDGQDVTLGEYETRWEIGEKISEKCFHYGDTSDHPEFKEASAVYHCQQVEGPTVGKEAIMKVRVQVPLEHESHPGSQVRASYALPNPPEIVMREAVFLLYLTEAGCSASPKLLEWHKTEQVDGEFLAGGFVVFVLMEKLPGVSLSNYDCHPYTAEERARIRGAFRKAQMELTSHGVHHLDKRPHNLHWDSKTGKCYILDYEMASHSEPGPKPVLWRGDGEFIAWRMAYRDNSGKIQLQ